MRMYKQQLLALAALCSVMAATNVLGADQAQFGQRFSRNMVSDESNLPVSFDPETGENLRWSAPLGTETNSTPVIAGGRVLIGTNNEQPRDPRHTGRRGVLLCLDEKTGKLCWQLVVPRFEDKKILDWQTGGICSPVLVEGERVYVVTNRAEVMCLDLQGQANGNDGPYQDEARHMTPAGDTPIEVTAKDADILWVYDMCAELEVQPHDAPYGSVLAYGDHLYVNTGNGIDRTHHFVPSPDAPSLIVLDKKTGCLLAQDGEKIGPNIFHCTWSSPSMGEVRGEPRIFFCGGDAVCYAFKPLGSGRSSNSVQTLERVWRFDCDPTAPKENVQQYIRNREQSPSVIMGMPVFYQNRIYLTGGGDIWWGKREAWVQCIDATQRGDVTQSAQIWSYPVGKHCTSTPAIHDGLVFVGDFGRQIHCLDADTGRAHWVQKTRGTMFSSALVADGKGYVGTQRRELWVFAADKEKQVLATMELDSPIIATPVAASGTLYIATMKKLYAASRAAR